MTSGANEWGDIARNRGLNGLLDEPGELTEPGRKYVFRI